MVITPVSMSEEHPEPLQTQVDVEAQADLMGDLAVLHQRLLLAREVGQVEVIEVVTSLQRAHRATAAVHRSELLDNITHRVVYRLALQGKPMATAC